MTEERAQREQMTERHKKRKAALECGRVEAEKAAFHVIDAVAESPLAASRRLGTPPRASDVALMSELSAYEAYLEAEPYMEYEGYLEAEEFRAYQWEGGDALDMRQHSNLCRGWRLSDLLSRRMQTAEAGAAQSHDHGLSACPQQTQEYEAYLEAEEFRAYQWEGGDVLDMMQTAGAGAVQEAIENGMTDPWNT